jgi:hypothetical protein
VHDYLYQVERVTKTLAGDVSYEATHFPIDDQGRSLLALDVAAAVGTGLILASGRTGVSCDVNSSSDNTIPAETFTEVADQDPYELTLGGESGPSDAVENPDDELDATPQPVPATPIEGPNSDTIGYKIPEPCGGNGGIQTINLYRDGALYATMSANKSVTYTNPTPSAQDASLVYLGGEYGLFQVANGTQYTWDTICNDGTKKQYTATNVPTANNYIPVYVCSVASGNPGGSPTTVDSYLRPAFWKQLATCSFGVYAYDSAGNEGYAGIFLTGTLPSGQCEYGPTAITVLEVLNCQPGQNPAFGLGTCQSLYLP